jgi:hypothetical protein
MPTLFKEVQAPLLLFEGVVVSEATTFTSTALYITESRAIVK